MIDAVKEHVTIAEAARRLGTTAQNLRNLRERRADFPPPHPDVSGAQVYEWGAVSAYYAARKGKTRWDP